MQPLQFGSRGPEVTRLQQMLKDAGFFPASQKTTEYFGPITQKALQDFQRARGLPVTGVFTPETKRIVEVDPDVKQKIDLLRNNGFVKEASMLDDMARSGDQRVADMVTMVNNGIRVNQQTLQANREVAQKDFDRYYREMQGLSRGDLDSFLTQQLKDLGFADEELRANLEIAKNDLDDTEGIKGTWASSARQERANNLLNKYNRTFEQNATNANTQIQDRMRNFEYNFGSQNLPQYQVSKTQAAFGPKTAFNKQSMPSYNPFGFAGRANAEKQANVNAGGMQNLTTQFYNPF